MAAYFAGAVESIVGPALAQLGFVLEEVDVNIDEGGLFGAVVYYRSADCKLQIYKSSREGSINCMIAPADAINKFGLSDRSLTWRFLDEFSPIPHAPIEELAKSVSYRAKSEGEQLVKVRDSIVECFGDGRAGMLEIGG